MHRIVIVGGGAGGLELATRLGDRLGKAGRAQIILVDRCPTHVWKPLLHEVAAGSLDTHAHQITYAAHAHWHHFEFVHGELAGLDREGRTIRLNAMMDSEERGEEVFPVRVLNYDTLVLALGSRTNFFGIAGAERNAITLDTLEQAERLRKHLLQTCVRSRALASGGKEDSVGIAIIGGGATGVELAAELRRMESTFRQFGLLAPEGQGVMKVTLLEAGERILPVLSPKISESTRTSLESMGIEVSVSDAVTDVSTRTVRTKSGRLIPADVTIWAAGIKAPDVLATLDGLAVNRINQIKVTGSLQSETDENIFAFGDCASCSWTGNRMVPPRAQAAHQQALFLFKALRARMEGSAVGVFQYKDHGSLVSLGSSSAVGSVAAVANIGNVFVKGLVANLMYAGLYQKHLMAVSGMWRMVVGLIAHGLRRAGAPRVKLH
ncbi:NAD(P)/FAD-dependent oxidoreductase [Paraburkholderia sp. HD33-4]|uniref:NAD(P)/FAD-dependent oxidoreductase n=1 Tax=Paraburkholderia sp. HD33-4 TaxID=2883242 RepID=UPI001F328FF0|nr:NAD(P)/FAD-dependent oxidoreductase [Paraburkholderia sp. HD33-4]